MGSGKRRRLAGIERAESAVEIRKRLLHERKETEERKSLLAVLLPVLGLTALIVGFGTYWEGWRKPRTPIAEVALTADGPSETITVGEFAPRVQYQRNQILQNLDTFMSLQISDPSFLTNMVTSQRDGIGTAVQDTLIDEALVRLEAERRGIEGDDDELRRYLINNDSRLTVALLGSSTPFPSGTPTRDEPTSAVTKAPTSTPAGTATPWPTSTATSAAEVARATDERATAVAGVNESRFERALNSEVEPGLLQLGLTRGQYLHIIRQAVLREKLNTAMAAEIPASEPHVEAEFLRFTDKASADAAAKAAAAGASWAELVDEYGPPEPPAEVAPAEGEAGTEGAPEATEASGSDGGAAPTGEAEPTGEPTGEGGPILQPTGTPEAPAVGTATVAAANPTAATAPTSVPATSVPSPTPDPLATEVSAEPKWLSRYALRTDTAFSITDEASLDKLMALAAGDVSEAVQASNGFLVIHAKSVDPDRAVDETELKTRRDGAAQDWLSRVKDPAAPAEIKAKIDKFPVTDKVPPEPEWFVTAMDRFLARPTVQSPLLDAGQSQQLIVGTPAPVSPLDSVPVAPVQP